MIVKGQNNTPQDLLICLCNSSFPIPKHEFWTALTTSISRKSQGRVLTGLIRAASLPPTFPFRHLRLSIITIISRIMSFRPFALQRHSFALRDHASRSPAISLSFCIIKPLAASIMPSLRHPIFCSPSRHLLQPLSIMYSSRPRLLPMNNSLPYRGQHTVSILWG
jgi:hypothetical protein